MEAALDVIRVLFEPTAVFERVREKPRYLAPFLVLCVVAIVINVIASPINDRVAELVRERVPQAAQQPGGGSIVRVILGAPIAVGLGTLLSGALLWLVVSLFGQDASFRTLLSVAAYTFVAGMFFQAASAAVLLTRGVATIASFQDVQAALGLNLLWPGGSGFIWTFLGMINPFTIWGLVLTAIGISTTHRTTKGVGYGAATTAFLIKAVCLAGLASVFARFMPR